MCVPRRGRGAAHVRNTPTHLLLYGCGWIVCGGNDSQGSPNCLFSFAKEPLNFLMGAFAHEIW